jgi:hypothetical protein
VRIIITLGLASKRGEEEIEFMWIKKYRFWRRSQQPSYESIKLTEEKLLNSIQC